MVSGKKALISAGIKAKTKAQMFFSLCARTTVVILSGFPLIVKSMAAHRPLTDPLIARSFRAHPAAHQKRGSIVGTVHGSSVKSGHRRAGEPAMYVS